MRRTMTGIGMVGSAAVLYGRLVRPRLLHWGATEAEVTSPYPGAGVVPDGERGATMAVTIDAPPDQVWPWLVQLGGDRAGWDSWDHLDNAGRASAREGHPRWQHPAVGDSVRDRTRPPGPLGPRAVAAPEPNPVL